jgi:hypothetical protein
MTRPRDQRDALGQALLFDAERYCAVCGRRLRSDASVARQLGPTCFRKRNVTPPIEKEKLNGNVHG